MTPKQCSTLARVPERMSLTISSSGVSRRLMLFLSWVRSQALVATSLIT
jgi:hypothetical protein